MSPAEMLAVKFHALYEQLAPETRRESAKPWAEVPEQNRALMIAVCEHILADDPEWLRGLIDAAVTDWYWG